MAMQKMNQAILILLGLVFASAIHAQGPPKRVTPFTVEKSTRFDQIPTPMQELDPSEYVSEASNVSGMVQLHFPNVKAGKFKKGSLSVIVRNKVVTSVSLQASSKKTVERLLKQMTIQFGDPYKLQSHQNRHYISWLADRKSKIDIRYESDEQYSDATVTIERK